jgi:hypothetical protein
MTNKEALQALLDGKKLRKSIWQESTYIYFDSEKDRILFDDGNNAQMPITAELGYEEYKELLNDKEREYLKSLVSAYDDGLKEKLVIKKVEIFGKNELIIGYVEKDEDYVNKIVSIQIGLMNYTFSELENLKRYTLEELGLC